MTIILMLCGIHTPRKMYEVITTLKKLLTSKIFLYDKTVNVLTIVLQCYSLSLYINRKNVRLLPYCSAMISMHTDK